MKLEHVTIDDMLRSYLKSNFANRNTLVIWPLSMPLTYRKLCQDRRLRPIFKLPFEQDDLRSM